LAVYIYGLNGAVAKRMGSTVLFLLKDHLGSTRVVTDATGLVRTYYDYDALGNIIRIGTTNEVKYQFTGQEFDETGMHNYRARLFDSDLGKFYAIDPAEQGWSPFVYAGNNPVIMVDRDGKLFFVPILVGAAFGAISSGAMYSVMAGESWTWKGFGSAVGFGALSGAISGGIGQLGGPLATNIGYSIIGNGASYAATTAISGGDLTWGGLLGSVAGGIVGGTMPGFQGVKGGALANIGAELVDSTVKGAVTGAVSGGVGALIEGRSIGEGWVEGAKRGAIGGAVGAGLRIAAFGHAIKPDAVNNTKAIEALNNMEAEMKLVGNEMGKYKPIYRSGGAWGLFTDRGIAMGRNLVIPDRKDYTFVHETIHYYQQLNYGFGRFLAKGMWEQWFLRGDPYTTFGTQEWVADRLFELYYSR
jgi:RHS repeat-associated protein